MSEEIVIKILAEMLREKDEKTENREIDIKINQNAAVNDLIEVIELNQELVDEKKYLCLKFNLKFNEKILTRSSNANLFETPKDCGIENNSILKASLLSFDKDSKPEYP